MTKDLVIVGAGGFGREVVDVVDAINAVREAPAWAVLGVIDDDPTDENLQRLSNRGIAYRGTVEDELATVRAACYYSIGIGSPKVRKKIAGRLDGAGYQAATLVHPSATTGFDVILGEGCVVCAGVRLTTNIVLGKHVHANLNATIGHDTTIADFVSLNPLSSISGDCVIEDEVLVGVAGVVLNGVSIGKGSVIGGSACVVRNVPEGVIVKGVPAR